MKPALFALALLLSTAVGTSADGTKVPATDSLRTAEPWTSYDWNASSGKGQKARFAIEDGGRLHVFAETPDDARFVRPWAVAPDTLYRLACRVRTEEVGPSARGAGLSVVGLLDASPDVRGTSGWRVVELYGKTGHEQRKLSVTVGVGGYGNLNHGSAWFDSVTVEKARNVPAGVRAASLEPPKVSVPVSTRHPKSGWWLGVFAALGLGLAGWGVYLRRTKGDLGGGSPSPVPEESMLGRPDRTDVAILAAMTVACLAISLWHLGGHAAPETGWQPARAGEAVTVELGRDADLSRIYYYCGINEAIGDGSRFSFSARTPQGTSYNPPVNDKDSSLKTDS